MMRLALLAVLLATLFAASLGTQRTSPVTSTAVYNNIIRFAHFADAAYQTQDCKTVNGSTVVANINIASTDTQGFIARDEVNKEIITVFRGSTSAEDETIDSEGTLVNYTEVSACTGCKVHQGFYSAWTSARSTVLSVLESQATSYPGYSHVVVGHSLGGALCSLASVGIKNALGYTITGYNFGQPRTGNPAYAEFHDSYITSFYRVTNLNDNVPQSTTQPSYRHHGNEYWWRSTTTNVVCSGDEDPTCNDGAGGVWNGTVNAAHNTYPGMAGQSQCVV